LTKPLIGITTSVLKNEDTGNKYLSIYMSVVKAVEQAGGLPIAIPCNIEETTLREFYNVVDAVLLPGGGDIDPARYSAEKHPKTGNINLLRDESEIMLVQWAADDDTPLLGICRGQQVLNVALGGTLVQHLDTVIEHYLPKQRTYLAHEIDIESDSLLAKIVGSATTTVNSIHHQSVEDVAESLRVVALSPDGVIEAVEIPGHRFALSVQWHPEDITEHEPMMRLFEALVDAAR
jgi:putative glutamine amidotransferase